MKKENLKLNKFVLYVSCIAIALFVFAYRVGEVKAEVTYSSELPVISGYVDIPSTDGDNMLVCSHKIWSGGATFTIGGNTSTSFFAKNAPPSGAGSYTAGGFSYLTDVSSGNTAITGDGLVSCILFEGVDMTNPITQIQEFEFHCRYCGSHNLTINNPPVNNLFMFGVVDNTWGGTYSVSSSTSIYDKFLQISGSYIFDVNFIDDNNITYVLSNTYNDFTSGFVGAFEINEGGGGGGEAPIEDPTSGIVSYFMFEDSYRCAQNSTCIIRYKYNQNYIPEDTNEMTLSDEDYNVIATSTIESFSELGKTNGSSRITFSVADNLPLGGYWYYANAEEDTDSEWVFASPIYIQIFDGSIPDATFVWDTDEDISTLWGDSYTLACSTEEWAEADDAGFFNMIRLKCHATKTTLDIFFGTLNVAKNVFLNIYESGKTLLKNMFPFNMIYKVKYQWDRSATLALPLDLILIENTVNSGELSVKINKELLSSSEDVYWVLWGDDLWAENTEVKSLFDFIRALSKYFMYALFLLGLYKMGTDFFNEYMYENKISSQRNSDYQYDQFKD